MIPVVRATDHRLHGGVAAYLGRRAKRILPPYFAALAASLLLIATIPGLDHVTKTRWDQALPAPFAAGPILSHLQLLIHNLTPRWAYKIDYPMWSVAPEWQIYFVFALLLLPVWRRFGSSACVVTALVVGFGLQSATSNLMESAYFWFLALFAFGMAGAVVSFSEQQRVVAVREKVAWGALATSFMLLPVVLHRFVPRLSHFGPPMGLVFGAAITFVLIACTHEVGKHAVRRSIVLRLFEARPVVGVGRFSYSLYLIHAPVVAAVYLRIESLPVSVTVASGIMLLVGVPLALVIAYIFFNMFEKPYLRAMSEIAS